MLCFGVAGFGEPGFESAVACSVLQFFSFFLSFVCLFKVAVLYVASFSLSC